MKTYISVFVIVFTILFSFTGCSDESLLPGEPGSAENLNSLNKVTITEYTAINYPVEILDPGTVKIEGQFMIIKNMVMKTRYEATSPLVTGDLILTVNSKYNLETGEGPQHGKYSKVPDNYPDGLWVGNWAGYRTKTGESEWTGNIHIVGHGYGGEIDGMQVITDEAVVSDDIFGQTGFYGEATGIIKSK
jgi:hypothetical protein